MERVSEEGGAVGASGVVLRHIKAEAVPAFADIVTKSNQMFLMGFC
ncbi:MAG: hypothetical protein ACRCTU_10745 [Zoogloea sp.]